MQRRTKIVATLGPASDGLEEELIASGLDVARLNFSHGIAADHARRCEAVRAAAARLGRHVAIMQDLQGPKIRVGRLAAPVQLREGSVVTIVAADVLGDERCIGCTYDHLADDVRPGDPLLLDDGRIRLRALTSGDRRVEARVEQGGLLTEHKGMNLPGVNVSAPALTAADRENLEFGLRELAVDYVALSFVRTAEEVLDARRIIRGYGRDTPIVVKIEKEEAIRRLTAIIRTADAVMVARGDLAVELAPERVPMLQKRIIHTANTRGIPVITATQMLESMVTEEFPTRAEASDVANAVWDGTDAVMLSEETAAGRHPAAALKMMDRIVREAEATQLTTHAGWLPDRRRQRDAAVTHAAQVLAEDIGAVAIIGVTRTGRTAELLSRARPRVPIVAFSPDPRTCRRLSLWWGVAPVQHPLERTWQGSVEDMERYVAQHLAGARGNPIVVVGAQPFKGRAHANFVQFQLMG